MNITPEHLYVTHADASSMADPDDIVREIALVWALDECPACKAEIERLTNRDYEVVVIDANEFVKGCIPPFVSKAMARDVLAEITTRDKFPVVVIGGEIVQNK